MVALVIIVKLAQGGTFGGSGNAGWHRHPRQRCSGSVIGETLPEDENRQRGRRKKNAVSPTGIYRYGCIWLLS